MIRHALALAAVVGLAAQAASAAVLYSTDFDTNQSANYTVNKSTAAATQIADFAFNYGAYGIPAAPGSTTTTGLKLQANVAGAGSTATFSGLSVSPTGQSFTGDYRMNVKVWLNYLGPGPAGGSGSTQAGGLGIGTAGTTSQWAGAATQESVQFASTYDGNSSVDYRVYSSAAATGYTAPSGVFAAGTSTSPDARNNSSPYYAGFGNIPLPPSQTAIYASQTGTTLVGSIGFSWHDLTVYKVGNTATWYIDNLKIATVDLSTVTLGGSNILLNAYDTNATQAVDPNNLNFALFDNLVVDTNVPEPTTLAALGLAGTLLGRRRAR